jgi:hypothetical protein
MADSKGKLQMASSVPVVDGYRSITLNKNNFSTLGHYPYGIRCNSTVYGGVLVSYFTIQENPFESSLTFLIFLYILAIIFFISTLFVDEEFFVYISGVLFLVGGIYIMINGLGETYGLYSRTIAYVSIGIGFLFTVGAYIFNSYSGRKAEQEED